MPTLVADARLLTLHQSLAVALDDGRPAFVVRSEVGLVAYENSCPHWNVDLDLGLGEFVDTRNGRIVCRNHGAEFDVATGLCLSGPCAGALLTPVRVVVAGDDVTVG